MEEKETDREKISRMLFDEGGIEHMYGTLNTDENGMISKDLTTDSLKEELINIFERASRGEFRIVKRGIDK